MVSANRGTRTHLADRLPIARRVDADLAPNRVVEELAAVEGEVLSQQLQHLGVVRAGRDRGLALPGLLGARRDIDEREAVNVELRSTLVAAHVVDRALVHAVLDIRPCAAVLRREDLAASDAS